MEDKLFIQEKDFSIGSIYDIYFLTYFREFNRLACCCDDGGVLIFDGKTGTILKKWIGHTTTPYTIQKKLGSDNLFMSVSFDGKIFEYPINPNSEDQPKELFHGSKERVFTRFLQATNDILCVVNFRLDELCVISLSQKKETGNYRVVNCGFDSRLRRSTKYSRCVYMSGGFGNSKGGIALVDYQTGEIRKKISLRSHPPTFEVIKDCDREILIIGQTKQQKSTIQFVNVDSGVDIDIKRSFRTIKIADQKAIKCSSILRNESNHFLFLGCIDGITCLDLKNKYNNFSLDQTDPKKELLKHGGERVKQILPIFPNEVGGKIKIFTLCGVNDLKLLSLDERVVKWKGGYDLEDLKERVSFLFGYGVEIYEVQMKERKILCKIICFGEEWFMFKSFLM